MRPELAPRYRRAIGESLGVYLGRVELTGIGVLHRMRQEDGGTIVRFYRRQAREIRADRCNIPEHGVGLGEDLVQSDGEDWTARNGALASRRLEDLHALARVAGDEIRAGDFGH